MIGWVRKLYNHFSLTRSMCIIPPPRYTFWLSTINQYLSDEYLYKPGPFQKHQAVGLLRTDSYRIFQRAYCTAIIV